MSSLENLFSRSVLSLGIAFINFSSIFTNPDKLDDSRNNLIFKILSLTSYTTIYLDKNFEFNLRNIEFDLIFRYLLPNILFMITIKL